MSQKIMAIILAFVLCFLCTDALAYYAEELVAEGATNDGNEATVSILTDPTADVTISIPSLNSGVLLVSTLTTNDVDVANSAWFVSNGLRFEGATANAFELTLSPADITADRTHTFPDAAGTVVLDRDDAAADSGATNNIVPLTLSSPADTTGTNTHNLMNLALTVGNATGGTNTVRAINIPAVTGDAQVTLQAIDIGALTGTSATEEAIQIGSGWDRAIDVTADVPIVTEGIVRMGNGGTVTQATSKSTGVTLNTYSGQITMNGAALAAGVEVGFTLTNSTIGAQDVVIVNVASGATADSYLVGVDSVAAGSCRIVVSNVSASSLSEAIVLNFVVIGGASS